MERRERETEMIGDLRYAGSVDEGNTVEHGAISTASASASAPATATDHNTAGEVEIVANLDWTEV